MMLRYSLAIAAALTASCATVDVYPVANEYGSKGKNVGADASGIRFFRPAPHVWLTKAPASDKVNTAQTVTKDSSVAGKETTSTATVSTATDGYSATVVMLPDYSKEYIVQWSAGMGSVTPNLTLAEGWNLTAFNSTVNSTGATLLDSTIGKTITAIGTVAAAGALTSDQDFKGPGLYRLAIDSKGLYSLGEMVLPLQ